ncbi:MAG: ATP-binding protein [Selenomonadaceae bacterium]|nr:ATP-binding protein [Selenomonadaceae bacterium]MBQ6132108.1 ATP-binding protein [Selenomonadaceae bacterium]
MNLQGLIVCRNLLDEEIFGGAIDEFEIAARLIERAERLGLSGNLYRAYLIYLLAHEPNLISTTLEAQGGKIGESLREIFKHDVEILLPILRGEVWSDLKILNLYKPTVANKTFFELTRRLDNLRTADEIADAFIEHYKNFGYGDIATYRAFRWDNGLVGVRHFETIRLDDLIGYAHQKELLTGNTTAFVDGKPANNVLLVGARGTGKSSGVKALVNEYYAQGLRLVQITKPQLKALPDIMEALRKFLSKRFIIFLDDLSFEESEAEYKYLKSAIEGGVESRPENVLIYATSNRRHLIRETWRDRSEEHDELYRDDSTNETISLSDRFGLIIHYYAPTQAEYLEIIRSMLKRRGIELDAETLRIEGLRWEMSHSGRNGRTAQQFVNYYLGQR